MTPDELDRILGGEEEIAPSPRFHAAVMRAVHREAAVPPPIPFPWTRAWPALTAGAVVIVASPLLLIASGAADPGVFDATLRAAAGYGAPWVALALLSTAGSFLLSRRLAGERP
jgi:predicted metal-binding membrane protein